MTNSKSKISINCLRALSLDQIANANSGHPGIALGAAPIFYTLFKYHLNVCPKVPNFFNRDRFIISAGHASSLVYATMVCAGYKNLTTNDLKDFRKINSKTPGHPEPHLLPGIEISSGPLGQGIAAAVGMAIAERKHATMFNVFGNLIDHYTYCFHGDGCLEEGVAYEAINLAGNLRLNKLILLYDSNKIQLDGKVSDSTSMKVKSFFKSCG
jgi:transketolase